MKRPNPIPHRQKPKPRLKRPPPRDADAAFEETVLALARLKKGFSLGGLVLHGSDEPGKHTWAERVLRHAEQTGEPVLRLRASRNSDVPEVLDSLFKLLELPQTPASGDLDHDLRLRLQSASDALRAKNRASLLLIERLDLASKKFLTERCRVLHAVAQDRLPVVLVATAKPTILGKLGRAHPDAERMFRFFGQVG